jgi:hypothetical protein
MRILSITAIAAVTVGLSLVGSVPLAAQLSQTNAHKQILGYQDPETGAFKPLQREVPDLATTPATTGTVELILTISLKTAVPTGGKVICGASLTATSLNLTTGTYGDWSEQAYTTATVSGSTATCTVNVPYSWVLPTASTLVTNSVTENYEVAILNGATATAVNTYISTGLVRYSSGSFYSGKVPATSTTPTKYAVNVTL